MTKTYKIVTIETTDIDTQDCVDIAVEAIKDYLHDYRGIDYDKQEQIFSELMRDVVENLKKTY